VGHWCRARETRVTPTAPVPTPAPSVTPAEAERLARQAEATCKAEVARVRCEIELTRIEREETGRVEAIERPRKDHEARAAAEKAKRDEKALRKKTRREAWWRFWETRRKARQQQHEKEGGQSGTLRVLLAFGIPATLALYFYAHSQEPSGEIFAVGLLTAVAAFAVGALLGFLFGIPRSVAKRSDPADGQGGKTGAAQNATADAAVAASAAQRFAPNTNLEEISDWLTKILVGVGLVQIHKVSGAIEDLADGLAPSLGGDSQGFAVAVTLMVSFSITGFVSAYLYTRLRLQGAFERALYQRVVETLNTAADAMGLVRKQLSPGDVDRPPLQELSAALTAARPGDRSQAFYAARDQRRKNWRGRSDAGEDKDYVAPTVGVFRALIEGDPKGDYHRLRGELGYALKDQAPPDLAGARLALTEAIGLRGPTEWEEFGFYEFNRAFCNIKLDLDANAGKSKATAELVQAIVADLETALKSKDARAIVEAEVRGAGKDEQDNISKWLTQNEAAHSEVRALLEKLPQ